MKSTQLLLLLTFTTGIANALRLRHYKSASNYPGIKFGSDRKLSITVFSDLHFGEPEEARNRHDADKRTIGVMNSVLNIEHPDLVVLNGDLISCEWVAPENANALVDEIVAPLVDRNLPFATTFGNHDATKTCSTRSMSEHMWNIKGSDGEHDQVGTSNYFIPIYSSSDNSKLAMLLWFFDSKGGRIYQPQGADVSVAGWVDDKVVSWFQQINSDLRQRHGSVPSLAFVHIPVYATRAFQKSGGRTEFTEPGLNEKMIGNQGEACDSAGNNCNYNGADTTFTKALVDTEGLMAVFSGHDHGVDWCMKWSKNLPENNPANGNGLHLCFNRHSGCGGYTDWKRGARQILTEEDKLGQKELETWIRLENGNISGRITLNSTYGTNQYSKADKSTSFVS